MLVVTDTISSGLSIAPLTEVLRDLRLSYDIVAVGFDTEEPARVEKLLGATIHAGKSGYANIYGHQALSGVDKSILDIHAKPFLKDPSKLADARHLTEEYADDLASEFEQMKDEEPASTQ